MDGQTFFITAISLLFLSIACLRPGGRQIINPPTKATKMTIEKHLKKLGYRCKDKVSGAEGVIIHVGFDLFGCVQTIVHYGVDSNGKPMDTQWFDIERLEILSDAPVMTPPDFMGNGKQAQGLQGPSEKPLQGKA